MIFIINPSKNSAYILWKVFYGASYFRVNSTSVEFRYWNSVSWFRCSYIPVVENKNPVSLSVNVYIQPLTRLPLKKKNFWHFSGCWEKKVWSCTCLCRFSTRFCYCRLNWSPLVTQICWLDVLFKMTVFWTNNTDFFKR